MSVSTDANAAGPFVCTGSQTEFPFAFYALEAGHIAVYVNGARITSGYSVTLNGESGGMVVMDAAPENGTRLVILRNVPFTQLTDIQNNTAFLPEIIERMSDKLTMICQQLKEELSRCVRVDPGSVDPPEAFVGRIDQAIADCQSAAETAQAAAIQAASAATRVFPDVSAMCSAPGLAVGTTVRTAGYYEAGDGGGAYYQVIPAREKSYDRVGNNVGFRPVFEGEVNVRTLGAKGDGITDDTVPLNEAQTAGTDFKLPVYLPAGSYKASSRINGTFHYDDDVTVNRWYLPNICQRISATQLLPGHEPNVDLSRPTNFRYAFRAINTSTREAIWEKAVEIKTQIDEGEFTYGNYGMTIPPSGTEVDCSGFVAWVLHECNFPNLATADPNKRLLASELVTYLRNMSTAFTEITSPENLQRGDIVFTGFKDNSLGNVSHVYVYNTFNTGCGILDSADHAIPAGTAVMHRLSWFYPGSPRIGGVTQLLPPVNASALYVRSEVSGEANSQFFTFVDGSENVLSQIAVNEDAAQARTFGIFVRKSGDTGIYARLNVVFPADTTMGQLHFRGNSDTTSPELLFLPGEYLRLEAAIYPQTDGTFSLGSSNFKWSQLYASTGSINTSDERLKQEIMDIPDEVLDAWEAVEFQQFRFKDAVAKKGDAARLHTGLIAQRIIEVFQSRGLDPFRYGLVCYDEWEAQEAQYTTSTYHHDAEYDSSGNLIRDAYDETEQILRRDAQDAGSIYSVRYDEALCMEAACQRRRLARIETKLAVLKETNSNQ